MVKDEKKLLDLLDEEEVQFEEKITVPPQKFDPVRKVASVMSRKTKNNNFSKLKGKNFFENIITCYLIENVEVPTINLYFDNNKTNTALPKLILCDVAVDLTGNNAVPLDYLQTRSLDALAVKIAGEIYHNLFSVFAEPIYVKSQKQSKVKKTAVNKVKENYQDEFGQFIPQDVETLVVATTAMPLFKNVKQRLPYVREVSELKYLASVGIYRDLIKNKELAQKIDQSLVNPGYTTRDVLVYSILNLHQDFFKEMNKNE